MIGKLVVKLLTLKMRLSDERGQDVIEYAMLGGLIAMAILLIVGAFSGALGSMANGIERCIDFDSTSLCSASFP
ncbi:MAG: Flp family type IVb pilin [Dehalococcoidia bacterium]|nr:Flp family type IVb pilin [Dehalococcoidia bacterium]